MEVLFIWERTKNMRYGAVDIGTNSCRLLIAEINGNKLNTVCRRLKTTRLGEGITQSGLIKEEAMERTLQCLSRFKDVLQEYEVGSYRSIATSAVREAKNGKDFVYQVSTQTGMAVDIVNGIEEARLSYKGVMMGLELASPPLVVDLGGGSTEFICPDQDVLLSIPVGAVRAAEADMTASSVMEQLSPLRRFKDRVTNHRLVIVGGTATSLVAIKKGLIEYDPEFVHGVVLSRGEIGDLFNLLDAMPLKLRRRLPGLQPQRADIIPKGALIMLIIMEILGKNEVTVSETDLLEGIIWSLTE